MINKKTFLILLFILPLIIKSQDYSDNNVYVVNTENLNVRDEPNSNSNIVHQVQLNDTLYVKTLVNNWYKIEYSQGLDQLLIGYVYKDFVKKTSKVSNEEIKKEQDLGFKSGFVYYGIRCFGLLLLASFGYYNYKTRIKDSRFSGGYREKTMNTLSFIKYAFYSLIISLPIALIAGIICYFA